MVIVRQSSSSRFPECRRGKARGRLLHPTVRLTQSCASLALVSSSTPEPDATGPRVRDLGELRLLVELAKARGGSAVHGGVIIDAGDDAAVLRPTPGRDLVATTDSFVENVHYQVQWLDARGLGARLAAANLSDLAAMAATPRWGLLSLGIRADHEVEDLLEVQRGLAAALGHEGAAIVGGNLARVDGPEWFDLTLLGEVSPGQAWTRSGARPGDLLAVSGHPGRSGAGLRLAQQLGDEARGERWGSLLDAWLRPKPRLDLAAALAATGCVTAAIDVSDGVATDLAQLCAASGVGVTVREPLWPHDELLVAAARVLGVEDAALRFAPSDDYELLLAIDPAGHASAAAAAREANVRLTIVGEFTDEAGVRAWMPASGEAMALPATGWDHFGTRLA